MKFVPEGEFKKFSGPACIKARLWGSDRPDIEAKIEGGSTYCLNGPCLYREWIEPERGERVLYGMREHEALVPHRTHPSRRVAIPTADGELVPGEYVGPGGLVVKVEVVG